MNKQESVKELSNIPGIGKKIAIMLYDFGIQSIDDLKNKNPDKLYCQMSEKYGTWLDKCLLYVFRCAVYYSKTKDPDPEKLKWWYWKNINNF